ncbi:hypothetical protein BN2497_2701 [Janthinobacterium sp. CG23_2]|nr:hypothetical protein BN2497_2701 [Janthinobacterium sp. CG23_2]CUU27748.1 hypothetical protein BN3177_2701 [Janthinobacterium sp. CG23_2]
MIHLLPCARVDEAQKVQSVGRGRPGTGGMSRSYIFGLYLVFDISIIAISCIGA